MKATTTTQINIQRTDSNQHLKKFFGLYQSIDHYDTDPGGQATYHNNHKIVFSFWRKWIKEAAIRGVLWEILQSLQLY